MDIVHNPNGSLAAIEGITSPCGRVFGKMGHLERAGSQVAKNLPGNKHQPLFKAGVGYDSSRRSGWISGFSHASSGNDGK